MNATRGLRWVSLALAITALLVIVGVVAVMAKPPQDAGRTNQALLAGEAAPDGAAIQGDYEWTPLGGPVAPGGQVNGLAVHPAISGTLYAAVAHIGAHDSGPSVIYASTDGAASWMPAYEAGNQVYALAVTGTHVYAGAFNPDGEGPAIYVSHNSGVNWTPVFSFTTRGVWLDMAVHPTDTEVAIAGGWTYDEGNGGDVGVVYATEDGGNSWSPLPLTLAVPGQSSAVHAVLIHPFTPTLVLVAAREGDNGDTILYRSEDGGATWPMTYTIPGAQVLSLAAHASDPDMLYAGTGGSHFTGGPNQVYRSTDAGQTWTQVFADAGGRLAFAPPSTVYAVAEWGEVFASPSNGDPGTWNSIGGVGDGPASFDIDLGPSPAALYVGGWERGVFKSSNGGYDWETRNQGIETAVPPRDIDVDPDDLAKIFAAAECSGGYLSLDGGWTWSQPAGLAGCMGAFAINPDDPSIVYGGAYDCRRGAVLRSQDGGANFAPAFTATHIISDCSGGGEQIFDLAIAPSMTSTVYAAGQENVDWSGWQAVIVRSLDDGGSWTVVFTRPPESRVETLAINPLDQDVVFAGGQDCSGGPCEGAIYRTLDAGANWTTVFTATEDNVRSLVVDYQNPGLVYAATDRYDVFKSDDGGDTWTLILSSGEPFWAASGNKLVLDPYDPNRIYLGGHGYIAESPDGGQTWIDWPLGNGVPPMEPRALTVDTGTPVQTLYAGFSGVWAYRRLAPSEGDRYVATNGSDDWNPCTDPDNPCQTIGHAIAQANPGETVRVAQGTYLENLGIDKHLMLEGGYSGPPAWDRDLDLYETIIESNSFTELGDWDGAGVVAPTVVYTNSQYEMWYTGVDMFGTPRIGHAAGGPIAWAKSGANPLLEGAEASVMLEGSTYRMWFSAYDSGCIFEATSSDGLAWAVSPDPRLCGTGDGSWDAHGVADPSVVKWGDTYWMFYEGFNWDEQRVQIGCATSLDGSDWSRCEGNPVLTPGPALWDENWVLDPAVVISGTDVLMWYQGRPYDGPSAIGHATSPDGENWTKWGANPVLEESPGTWDEGGVRMPAVWFDGVDFHLWYASNGMIGYASSGDGTAWTKHADPVLEPGHYGAWGEPVVRFEGGSDGSRLDGFTVTGGDGQGGVVIDGGTTTVAHCTVTDNESLTHWGGGIHVGVAATALISHTDIISNVAGSAGGLGAINDAVVWLSNSVVSDNWTTWGAGGGIGLWWNAAFTATDSLISYNTTTSSGGGMEVSDGASARLEGTEVLSNTAHNWAGGISAGSSRLSLDGVQVAWNESLHGEGGGLVFWSGTEADLTDVAVVENWAEHGAGGINVGGVSSVTLELVEINGNESAWGTALRVTEGSRVDGNRVWIQDNVSWDQNQAGFRVEGSVLNLHNTLITGNAGGAGDVWGGGELTLNGVTLADNSRGDGQGGVHVYGDAFASVLNSILVYNGDADLQCDDPGTCTVEYSDLQHPVGGLNNISTNPRFVDRASGDYHLEAGSPCIDAADPGSAPGEDLDGDDRPWDGDDVLGALPDMGADEYVGDPTPIQALTDLYVDGDAPQQGNGTQEVPYATVGEAAGAAFSGDTGHVADGTYVENVYLGLDLSLLGGYSGVPTWERNPELYETVLDGSGRPIVPGDWDGEARYPMVVYDGTTYEMWYTGYRMLGPSQFGYATSSDGVTWDKYEFNPVLPAGEEGAWDSQGLEGLYVIKEDATTYKMWYSAFGPDGCGIGYATSSDGVNWAKHAGNPVLVPGVADWNNNCVLHPSIIYEEGVYKMWLLTVGDDGTGPSPHMATITSTTELDWTWDHGTLLFGRDWEEWMWRPYVLHVGSTYHMWYSAWWEGRGHISYASSSDGVGWAKHGSPVLSGTPGEWDEGATVDPGVLHDADASTFTLWYDNNSGIGAATSDDGIGWAKLPENPLLEPGWWGDPGAPVVEIAGPGNEGEAAWRAMMDGQEFRPNAWQTEQGSIEVLLDGLTITQGEYWVGSGVYVSHAAATIQNSTIVSNTAVESGGGVYVSGDASAVISATAVLSNTAGHRGGGIWNNGPTLIDRSWIAGNAAGGFGGGLTTCCSDWSGETTIQNTFLVGNHAEQWGGAIAPLWSGTLMNVTVADNTCTQEGCIGGVGLASNWPTQTHTLVNSILYFNDNWDLSGDPNRADVSYCDVYTSTFELTGPGNIDTDPLFGDAYHLTLDSPPRDAGTDVGAPGYDYDGDDRPFAPGTPDWDMGADEWWPTPSLTLTAETLLEKSGLPGEEVTYWFTVTNTGDYTDTFDLALDGALWPTRLSASSTGELGMDESESFTVTVEVPHFQTQYDFGSDTFTLTATSNWPEYPAESLSGTTTAVAQVDVTLALDDATRSGLPGTSVTYTLSVHNAGQYTDTYALALSGLEMWTTSLSAASVGPLGAGDSDDVVVTVDVPDVATQYVYDSDTFTVTATSGWLASVTDSASGTTTAEAVLSVAIGPASSSAEGKAGEVVAYTLTVTNTGEYEDDYTLSVSSGWAAELSTLTLTDLGAQASATVVLSVTVPTNAGGADSDTATVTVQSDTDATVTAQAQATTGAADYTIFLPLIMRNW